jgi:RHS repeat-associated protein
LNRLKTETSAGVTHSYTEYDKAGNRLKTVYGGTGRALVSTYNPMNLLATCEERDNVSTPSGRTTTYAYDLTGKVTRKTLPNGNRTNTSYDLAGRTWSLQERRATANALVSSFEYSYDKSGNVRQCAEISTIGGTKLRTVINSYDRVNRLTQELFDSRNAAHVNTEWRNVYHSYDAANNRTGEITTLSYSGTIVSNRTFIYADAAVSSSHNSNQLETEWSGGVNTQHAYDANGNLTGKYGSGYNKTYAWDHENRLTEVATSAGAYSYAYDHRFRRVKRDESSGGGQEIWISFSGGTSVQERTPADVVLTETIRGSDWGGGVGGVLYTIEGGNRSYNGYNSRGDVVSVSGTTGTASWQAAYYGFGTRHTEVGTNTARQRANTKDEDPTGFINEGFRYRDIASGTFISRDPAGFVDGPNVYTYVRQNPWTSFDPLGLSDRIDDDGFKWADRDHHIIPREIAKDSGWGHSAKEIFNKAVISTKGVKHDNTAHPKYTNEVGVEMAEVINKYLDKHKISCLANVSEDEQIRLANVLVAKIEFSSNQYIRGFNKAVPKGAAAVKKWYDKEGQKIVMKSTGQLASKGGKAVNGMVKVVGKANKIFRVPLIGGIIATGVGMAQGKSFADASIGIVENGTGADIAHDVYDAAEDGWRDVINQPGSSDPASSAKMRSSLYGGGDIIE